MSAAPHPANPYVGPRAFQTGEQLYGRTRELDELRDLLIAQRIVLFYSPSGAGKTSLIQAGLIPALRDEDFVIGPPLRVGLPAPGAGGNRYAQSVLLSLNLPLLAPGDTLAAALARRPPPAPPFEVFIFDQFEEVLTLDPTDVAVKAAFFDQLGVLLSDRNRWAVFALREDYLAALDPYRRRIPTRLETRYRLDLLGTEAAQEAIIAPAAAAGVTFAVPAAARLTNDLRRVRVQQLDGTPSDQLGPYVEPVQLQVVCRALWERLPPGVDRIDETAVAAAGDVNTALAAYYADSVAAIAAHTGVPERTIREWCAGRLITLQGLRSAVLSGPASGLDPAATSALVDAHLLRAEERGGRVWYELAHDRLVAPIQADNQDWAREHLSLLQRQAPLWEQEGRPDRLLLTDPELTQAEDWASAHPQELTPPDEAFLVAARRVRQLAQAEQARQRAEVEGARRVAAEERARRLAEARVNLLLRIGVIVVTLALIAALIYIAVPFVRRALAAGELVTIPAGQVQIGTAATLVCEDCENEKPQWPVTFTVPFALERYEVANWQYRLCVENGTCSEPGDVTAIKRLHDSSYDHYPVTDVDARQAFQYCLWLGRRLPTELEWERAARGPQNSAWPWGNTPLDPDKDHANLLYPPGDQPPELLPVDALPAGRSAEGLYNLIGNVWEWTASYGASHAYRSSDPPLVYDPLLVWPDGKLETLRGSLVRRGGGAEGEFTRLAIRRDTAWDERPPFSGFRCAAGGAAPVGQP